MALRLWFSPGEFLWEQHCSLQLKYYVVNSSQTIALRSGGHGGRVIAPFVGKPREIVATTGWMSNRERQVGACHRGDKRRKLCKWGNSLPQEVSDVRALVFADLLQCAQCAVLHQCVIVGRDGGADRLALAL